MIFLFSFHTHARVLEEPATFYVTMENSILKQSWHRKCVSTPRSKLHISPDASHLLLVEIRLYLKNPDLMLYIMLCINFYQHSVITFGEFESEQLRPSSQCPFWCYLHSRTTNWRRGGCCGLVNQGLLYHVISQYKTNLVLSLNDSVADMENVVQFLGHSAQQHRLDVKIEGFLSSYCYIDVYLVVYWCW